MIHIIAAMDRNRNIGLNGDLPWGNTLKTDLAHFKEKTKGKTIVMGRKTFESLPGLLPDRHHVVLTKEDLQMSHPSIDVANSIDELKELYAFRKTDWYIIGGTNLFSYFMPFADQVHLTKVHAYLEGDTKMPTFYGSWDIQQEQVIEPSEHQQQDANDLL